MEKWFIAGTLAICVGFIALIAHLINEDQKKWDAFAAQHKCQVVAKIKGGTAVGFGTGVGSGGKVTSGPVYVTEPDKTGYLCDDGVTYYR